MGLCLVTAHCHVSSRAPLDLSGRASIRDTLLTHWRTPRGNPLLRGREGVGSQRPTTAHYGRPDNPRG